MATWIYFPENNAVRSTESHINPLEKAEKCHSQALWTMNSKSKGHPPKRRHTQNSSSQRTYQLSNFMHIFAHCWFYCCIFQRDHQNDLFPFHAPCESLNSHLTPSAGPGGEKKNTEWLPRRREVEYKGIVGFGFLFCFFPLQVLFAVVFF